MIALAALTALAGVAHADVPPDYDFNWANIADRNNPAVPGPGVNAGRGSIPYAYRIAKFEVTTQQWADFLNMALRQGVNTTQYGLRPDYSWGATNGGGVYIVKDAMRPVIGLNWRAGAYYCNWLNNGKQESWASCQYGAYDASTFGDLPDGTYTDQLAHSPDAKFWIPTYDEWLKAAHFDPNRNGSGQGGWWTYPYRSNSPPVPGPPPPGSGQTTGGWNPGGFGELLVPLGAYTNSTSAYGLWDLSGASQEWTETPAMALAGGYAARRADGSYAGSASGTASDHIHSYAFYQPVLSGFLGFRIASSIPAPPTLSLLAPLYAMTLASRRR